jgi:agmatine deiminase
MIPRMVALWAQMTRELLTGEKVHINVRDAAMEAEARASIRPSREQSEQIVFHHFPTNDAWVRDHGPIFVFKEERGGKRPVILDWDYNAWGGKYPPFDLDDAIPSRVAEALGREHLAPGMVLEGGSIEVNGRGTLLTTESCLLNPNRNPNRSREEIEAMLRRYLGVSNILWLKEGIVGDDTDGHIDDITRFISGDTVITALEADPTEENYLPLQENLQRLKTMKDQDGRPLNILTLPMPDPVVFNGARIPASYANFYIANEVVLVPVFRDAKDAQALEILRGLFPKRRVLGIDCRELVVGLGGIHCVTQQIPAAGCR